MTKLGTIQHCMWVAEDTEVLMPQSSIVTDANSTALWVQVKDWANGEAADIGELQVVAGSQGTGYSTGAGGAAAADMTAPFYQQLAQHAQYLEVRCHNGGTAPELARP